MGATKGSRARASKARARSTRYLIIGNSAGGVGAAEAIRQVDPSGVLTIVSDEPYPAYSRPEISEYLAGLTTVDGMLFRPPDFYEQHDIDLVLDRQVTALDLKQRQAKLADGSAIAWEKLLLATGGVPASLKIDGIERQGIFTFTTIADADRIRAALGPGCRVVVIGAGLIGLSLTHALVRMGVPVTVVELLERPLATALDREAGAVVERALRDAGVRVVLGQTAVEVLGRDEDDSRVGGVRLQNGETLPCDVLGVAVGVRPRTELAQAAGIKVNRGILVDRHMATSAPDVFACGDCAEAFDFVHGEERVTPVWPNAYMGGRVAGLNMAGRDAEYAGAGMNALSYFGLAVVSAGVQEPEEGAEWDVRVSANGDGVYRRVVFKNNRIVGLTFVGDIERAGIIFGLMREGRDVTDLKDAFTAADFGLAHLPDDWLASHLSGPRAAVVA
jgi:NAD(P)H-nitrite reductase large subunit